jgi:hypothetical protein
MLRIFMSYRFICLFVDDDEVQFLDFVEQKKLDADKQKELEEISEINDYREKIATLQEQNMDTVSDLKPH